MNKDNKRRCRQGCDDNGMYRDDRGDLDRVVDSSSDRNDGEDMDRVVIMVWTGMMEEMWT